MCDRLSENHNITTRQLERTMQTNEPHKQPGEPLGVQRDSETPLPQKPSVLFVGSTVAIVITFIIVTILAYNGIAH